MALRSASVIIQIFVSSASSYADSSRTPYRGLDFSLRFRCSQDCLPVSCAPIAYLGLVYDGRNKNTRLVVNNKYSGLRRVAHGRARPFVLVGTSTEYPALSSTSFWTWRAP